MGDSDLKWLGRFVSGPVGITLSDLDALLTSVAERARKEQRALLEEMAEALAYFEFDDDGVPQAWPNNKRVDAILAKLRDAGVLED